MTERPILFSGPMVRAILEGRKTQTRRVAKLNASGRVALLGRNWHCDDPNAVLACPYGQPGDRLWVRETWRQAFAKTTHSNGVIYRADAAKSLGMDEYSDRHRWRPSIHMPRWALRITLEIAGVRVERLQEISEDDAEAEGFDRDDSMAPKWWAVDKFRDLWDSINGKTHPWASNPWVWVVEFRRAGGEE